MTDLQTLHDAWDPPAPPAPAARAEARAALRRRAARRPGRRRALVAAVAAAGVVAINLDGRGPQVPLSSAEVLERAAAAEHKPFAAPRPSVDLHGGPHRPRPRTCGGDAPTA